jgi:hypothetical protein
MGYFHPFPDYDDLNFGQGTNFFFSDPNYIQTANGVSVKVFISEDERGFLFVNFVNSMKIDHIGFPLLRVRSHFSGVSRDFFRFHFFPNVL